MKKMLLGLSLILMSGTLTSCYNTRVVCGNLSPNAPVVKVNSEWNHHFIYGLVPGGNTKIEANKYVDNAENYVVKTNQSFINGLVSALTFGLYTPTTTTYYLPVNVIKK